MSDANAEAVVKQPRRKPARSAPQWPMSLAIVLGIASAMGGLGAAFTDGSWWFVAVGVAALVTAALAAVRAYTRYTFLIPLAGVIATLMCLTFSFAPTVAWVGVIPNFDVFELFGALVQDGFESIADQSIPADPVPGIVFIVTVGSAILAIALDQTAFVLRRPALIGIPLLGVLLVPTFFRSDQHDPIFFFLTAGAYLLILYLGLGEVRTGGAIGVGAGSVAIALILPLVLPPVAELEEAESGPGLAVGVNSFITLGENLRRTGVSQVLTYQSDSTHGVYLTVSIIRNLEGNRWMPATPVARDNSQLDDIDPVLGLSDAIERVTTTTDITIVNMGGHWLPAPYAPQSVTGADEDWSFDPDNLSIDSPTESARGEVYQVTSETATPTVEQLRASGDAVGNDLAPYLVMPAEPSNRAVTTAQEVAAGTTNHFDAAIALQNYFTGGEFTYSETAPVEEGYDGGGAGVVARFLVEKSGYCVHFASAMAIMARSLGIPSRIAIGFTPGEQTPGENGEPDYFSVMTTNFHAWPELWFEGIGWVRFEPTPSRGETPSFVGAESTGPDPVPTTTTTPVPTKTPTPTATPTATTTPTAAAVAPAPAFNQLVPRITIGVIVGVAIIVLLLPFIPVFVRGARRIRRYWQVRRGGSARAAWEELRDTAIDLGWDTSSATPRKFASVVRHGMSAAQTEALSRLLIAVENTAYSRDLGRSTRADLRVVRRAMWKLSTRRERLGALFTPASAAQWARELRRR